MPETEHPIRVDDQWSVLNRFTNARIALGRAGMSLTTKSHLEFQLAHARARDSVNIPLDFSDVEHRLKNEGFDTTRLNSRAPDRATYLQRPDLGRLLNATSEADLKQIAKKSKPPDIALTVADGLSSMAIRSHAVAFLKHAMSRLQGHGYDISPVCLIHQGRVAVGDHAGVILSARMSVILIGERPGLSSPDSMGIYFTYRPCPGLTDADRNCISNIHGKGLSYETATDKLTFLITEADRLKLSGVALKEGAPADALTADQGGLGNFFLE